MDEYCNSSPVQKVKFKKIKKNHNEDNEILIPSMDIAENTFPKKRNGQYLKPFHILLSAVLVFITVLSIAFIIVRKSDSNGCLVSDYKEGKNYASPECKTNVLSDARTSCRPFHPVSKIIIYVVYAPDYHCYDYSTCNTLLQTIEQNQEGLEYSFVISAGRDLYIGKGFKCGVSSSDNSLNIKILRRKSAEKNPDQCFKAAEVIEQGLLCGKILPNYTVSVICGNDVEAMNCDAFDKRHIEESLIHHPKEDTYIFHEPNPEVGTIIQNPIKWTACGDAPLHSTELQKQRVIMMDNVAKPLCRPYKPVDNIIIDIIEEPSSLRCSDNSSCTEMKSVIESQHSGFKYNFIIGHQHDLYVGLGFRCAAHKGLKNVLTIKALISLEHFDYEDEFEDSQFQLLKRICQILEQGLDCGKISYNYSVSIECPERMSLCLSNHRIMSSTFKNHSQVRHFANYHKDIKHHSGNDTAGEIVKHHHKWMACHRKHISGESSASIPQETTSHVPVTTHSIKLEETTGLPLLESTSTTEESSNSEQLGIETESDYDGYIDVDWYASYASLP